MRRDSTLAPGLRAVGPPTTIGDMSKIGLGLAIIGALAISCGGGNKGDEGTGPDQPAQIDAGTTAVDPDPDPDSDSDPDPDPGMEMPEAIAAGSAIFDQNCAGCHRGADRKGPEIVEGYNSRDWTRAFLQDPRGDAFYGRLDKKKFKMKAIKQTGEDLDALVEFVYANTGASDADAGLASKGESIFDDENCSNCHSNDDDSEDDVGPNLKGRGSVDMLQAFIADPDNGRWFGKKNQMDSFKDELSAEQISQVAQYIVWLRDR